MKRIMRRIFCLSLLCLAAGVAAQAQETKNVKGKYTLTFDETENLTMSEAKQECVNRARCEAIKEAFGERITSVSNMVDASRDGKSLSQFVEETNLMSQAEWLGDTKEPRITTSLADGKIMVTAEVWGKVREITQSKIDFKWKVLCGGTADRNEGNVFNNKERLYVSFSSPSAGYLAIYLLDSSNKEASCLLPYKDNQTGQQRVYANHRYVFFDKDSDPDAIGYRLTTKSGVELDQVVLIFSPNPFTKCSETGGDRLHPNSLGIADFEKWLTRARSMDKDMVIDRTKWVRITNTGKS